MASNDDGMPFNDDGNVLGMGYWPDYGSKSERIT